MVLGLVIWAEWDDGVEWAWVARIGMGYGTSGHGEWA